MTDESGPPAMPEIKVPAWPTFAALIAGLLAGIALGEGSLRSTVIAIAEPVGALWLQALKMTILPLVAGLVFISVVQTASAARGGILAKRTLILFLAVLSASAAIGVLVMPLLLELSPLPAAAVAALGSASPGAAGTVPGFADLLASFIPNNIVSAAAGGAMLPVITFVALLALAATRLAEAQRRPLQSFFKAIAAAMMVVVGWVLMFAPAGVFALAIGLAAKIGTSALGALAHYALLVSAVGVLILLGAYLLGVLAARKAPLRLARALLPAQLVAVSTQSSLASLPAMLASCRLLGVRETSADFVLPLAVTIFRATSPAMNLAVAIYAAKLAGVELGPAALLAGGLTAILISLSTVSLPGTISFIASVGPIALAMGVPIEPLAILVAVEMLPDIMRTVGNVSMNVAVAGAADHANGGEEPYSSSSTSQ